MLRNISVILVRPRFPENIGMAARAMANMGVSELILVDPERWDKEKALPLATAQASDLLDSVTVADNLASAVAPCVAAYGTTARTGGWRQDVISPEKAALELRAIARQGGRAALVFGSEDRGLENDEVERCTRLVNIPTVSGHSSLNLAQAVLLMLYECAKADMALPFAPEEKRRAGWTRPAAQRDSRRATLAEEALLLERLQDLLVKIDYLPDENPSWFMQPMRRFLRKGKLRRHEFDMLMGICRQVGGALGRKT